MTPDSIAPDPRDDEETSSLADDGDVPTEGRVRVYDGLVVDTGGNPGTIGADSNGD